VHKEAACAITSLDRRTTIPSQLDEFGGVQAEARFLLERSMAGIAALFQKRFDGLCIKPLGGGLGLDWRACGRRPEKKGCHEKDAKRSLWQLPEP
jgi:hypothetical protein